MDYTTDRGRVTNRVCTLCWSHWHGPSDNITRYTRKEWDALMEDWRDPEQREHDDRLIAYHESIYGARPPGMTREDLLKTLRGWRSIEDGAASVPIP
jgi:hypothetical protein